MRYAVQLSATAVLVRAEYDEFASVGTGIREIAQMTYHGALPMYG